MKRKPLILLLVLALCFALVACDTGDDVKSFTIKDFDQTEYSVGDTIDYDNILLEINYKSGETAIKTVKDAGARVSVKADLSKPGNTSFTIELHGYTRRVNITVVGEHPQTNVRIETFSMPTFWTQYETRSTETAGDGAFKTLNAVYEVGNMNKFVVEPRATGWNGDERVTYNSGVKTTASLSVSDRADGGYKLLTGDALDEMVTIDGNTYKFTDAAAGNYFKLKITIDKTEYDMGNIRDNHTISFKVVGGGYNVYNQAGLAVMTDLLKPELWADVLGCTVENGEYVPGETPLKLTCDEQPLYTYIGNVDWVILHGNVNVVADNLPDKYFISSTGEYAADYNTALTTINNSGSAQKDQMKAQLEGSLYDGNGNGKLFRTTKVAQLDDNGQKGLYASSRISVSGNYNSITVDNTTTAGKRKIKTVAFKNMSENIDLMVSWWSLFKLDEVCGSEVPGKNFTVKNVALKGNSGRTENLGGAQGVSMLNCFGNCIDIDNVVADSFYSNIMHDNFCSNVVFDNTVRISNSKISNTYNTMALTWRGNINIVNSSLKDCGGPLFILDDGKDAYSPDRARPQLTYDADSYLEAYANGTESWYMSLGDIGGAPVAVTMFTQLNRLNTKIEELSGKSFFHTSAAHPEQGRGYASVLSVLIPEASWAFAWPTDDGIDHSWQLIAGKVTTPGGEYASPDPVLTQVKTTGTVLFKSGNNYAMVADAQSLTLMDPTIVGKISAGVYGEEYMTNEQFLADYTAWMTAWRTSTVDTISVWLQGAPGNAYSPYIQVLFGGFRADQTTSA